MTAAIYARKSTAQHDVDDDARSVARQVENARAFAADKGWTVLDAHIYVDDGISGASTRLPAKARMVAACDHFDVIVCQARDRFSRRDGDESFSELKAIAKRGVQVWFYSDGSHFQFGDFASNTLGFLKGEFAAEYRRAVSQKTAEALKRLAQRGHVTGGRVFGYDNIAVDQHVERRINPTEAAVVRRIFTRCADGVGYTRLAKLLNAEGSACPRPQQGRPAGWSPSTVRAVLHNALYRGEVVWNKTKKRDLTGDVNPTRRAEAEWLRVAREDLRIVTDAQWHAAHARRRWTGPRTIVRRDYESNYLLTGFARCACGSSLAVISRSHGRSRKVFYGCLANTKRGRAVCANDLVLPLNRVDDAVLKALGGDALRPAVVSAIIEEFLQQLLPANVETRADELHRALRLTETKIAHLTAAIEQGGPLASLVAVLTERQAERDALLVEVGRAETFRQIVTDRAAIEAEVLGTVARWRQLLTGSISDGRQVLREVLAEPLRFVPEGKVYRFRARVTTGRIIAGAVGVGQDSVASPTGFEPVFWP